MSTLSLHPMLDSGKIHAAGPGFKGGLLQCLCAADKVEVELHSQTAYAHFCGCTKCWKPKGAMLSLLSVVPRDKVHVKAHAEKLEIVDRDAVIHRYACKGCGAHMYGVIENKDHPFYSLAFVHTELSPQTGWDSPKFSAFVSSVIEAGMPPARMGEVRQHLRDLGQEPYDCLSPELMDMIAAHAAKSKGTLAA